MPCVLRSRAGVFGAALFTFGILPVAFIQPRTLDAIYIPMAGLALWAGVMIARIADGVLAPLPQLARAAVVFLLIAMVPARAYAVHEDVCAFSREYAQIRSVREQLKARYPAIRPGSRILF
ncbi:MAG: hypothetical protein M3Y07_19270, partial [Acidobacteriota bacterium]|nr:hypothetical protein [Acidobacteriota bacterium]